jgi:molybdopterin-containing oxidoreductase family iron-sulfur binding subunit
MEPTRYWMSLAGDEQRPPERAEADGSAFLTTRRSFLKAAGFSVAGALTASCSRGPVSKAVPYIQQPEGFTPGRPVSYASTCDACEAGCGVIVTTRDGRPLKIEGNPDHPLSGGATCAAGQAAILGLYDDQRLHVPLHRGRRSTWTEVDQVVAAELARIRRNGGAVRLLTPTVTSPTADALMNAFLTSFANARRVVYDPISSSAILDAYALTHGVRLLPRYLFDQAHLIVSFDADFLGSWFSPVEHTRGYSAGRRPDERTPTKSFHIHVESRLSLTGSNADHRVIVAPGDLAHLVTHVAVRVADLAGMPLPATGLASSPLEAEADTIARRLWTARNRGLVVSGSQDRRVQALCAFINYAIGAEGVTIDLDRPSYQRSGRDADVAALRAELSQGEVAALFVAGVNPIYDLPNAETLARDLGRVELLVSTAQRVDETSALATVVCPSSHPLESWGDAEPVAGVVSVVQPTILPLHDTRTLLESLEAWTTGSPRPALTLVREHWERAIYPRAAGTGQPESFDQFWDRTLERGFIAIASREGGERRRLNVGAVDTVLQSEPQPTPRFALVLYQTVAMLDGRHAHNAWLHELPDPVTKVTWDNYACFSPAAARRLDIRDGDVVRVASEDNLALELPAIVQPGQHDTVVAIALGYGRAGTERFNNIGPPWLEARRRAGVVGVRASGLITAVDGTRIYAGRPVVVAKTGLYHPLASTQTHHSLTGGSTAGAGPEARSIVQELTLGDLRQQPVVPPEPPRDLWPTDHPHPGHRWGMTVDLNACTGCSACVIACQAENNVPVVGQDEVRRGREMHWIRIDRYYAGSEQAPELLHQPMMCQHCENAPCETVCPVLATVHSDEGLNEQVYNRCVGTRYCANNCPYKVRRFNWFDYPHEDALQNLVFNPNVTVRSRGVMEKCTLCVQRIEEAKIEARRTGQRLADGAIKTACQQVCPAEAIVFGDLNDPTSRVARLAGGRRAYRVLEDLNTKPAVRYLKLLRHDRAADVDGRRG